jgi:secondary thiamine-phosphate synthase enzyme
MVHSTKLAVATSGRGTFDITSRVVEAVATSGITHGVTTVWIHHTSASLIICENADATVRRDLEAWMARVVVDGDGLFTHTAEGPDDMPAHVRSVLTQTSLSIPILEGELVLGTWQGIYVWEHRRSAHKRHITITIVGDKTS